MKANNVVWFFISSSTQIPLGEAFILMCMLIS